MQEAVLTVEPLAVSIPQAAKMMSVCSRTVNNLIAAKELPSKKIGKRRVIGVADIQNFLRSDHKTSRGGQ